MIDYVSPLYNAKLPSHCIIIKYLLPLTDFFVSNIIELSRQLFYLSLDIINDGVKHSKDINVVDKIVEKVRKTKFNIYL